MLFYFNMQLKVHLASQDHEGFHLISWALTMWKAIGKDSCSLFGVICKIPLLKLVIELLPNTKNEEEHFVYLTNLDEMCQDVALANDSLKKRVKAQYDKSAQP